MLVKFISSETGELMMFADMAAQLLRAEMLPAARLLREAVARGEASAGKADDDDDGKDAPVALGPRAWPLIDMLERSSKGGAHANIVWEAAADF